MKYAILSLVVIVMFSLSYIFRYAEELSLEYEPAEAIELSLSEIGFWENKLEKEDGNRLYRQQLAHALAANFDLTGNIVLLNKAVNILNTVVQETDSNSANTLRSLAYLKIKKHDFKNAKTLLTKALASGEDQRLSKLMLFDVNLELGNYEIAESLLKEIEVKKDFDYLIRSAKWSDHNDDIEQAIVQLEEAQRIAEYGKNKDRLSWIYSNLGDFYGHAGDLERSKKSFKQALGLNKADWYSYKGVARMYWSAENDNKRALKMLDEILVYNESPSLFLLKSDILEHSGQTEEAIELREMAHVITTDQAYGNMYNASNFEFFIENGDYEKASLIAQNELQVRNTASSHALVALSEFYGDEKERAKTRVMQNVVSHTYEPGILLSVMPVLSKDEPLYSSLSEMLRTSTYELGPLATAKMNF